MNNYNLKLNLKIK